jgi:Zn-dependent peptidase ImmA (M78 family)
MDTKILKLLKKYKLSRLKIIFVNSKNESIDGCYSGGVITIYLLNHSTKKDLLDTILHELAHAILHKRHKPYLNHTPEFYRVMVELS